MKILLQRIFAGKDYTIGRMYIDGKLFCDTLELPIALPDGRMNVPRKTAIPQGVYSIVVNMSPKFKRLLPRLVNVPHRDGILIHRGNTPSDISGCILPGENKVKGKVLNSTQYERKLVELMLAAQSRLENIIIDIRNP